MTDKAGLDRDIAANKAEIHQTLTSMFNGVYIIAALIIAGYMLTNRNDAQEIRRDRPDPRDRHDPDRAKARELVTRLRRQRKSSEFQDTS